MHIIFRTVSTLLFFTLLAALPAVVSGAHRHTTSSTGTETSIRVVSLAPHLTELVYAINAEDRLIGTVEWSDYPEAAQALPRIGDAFRFDMERIIGLRTTHALSWVGGTPQAAVDQLQSLGIEVIQIQTRTLDEIATAMLELGDALGQAEAAQSSVERFGHMRKSIHQIRQDQPVITVFYQVSERPIFTLGGPHVINEVFELCGARNIFIDLPIEASVVGREAVITAQPHAMIAGISPGQTNSHSLSGADDHSPLDHWSEFDAIPAVACGHLWTVDPALLVRPTPRILEGAVQLCQWLDQVRQASAANPACSIDGG